MERLRRQRDGMEGNGMKRGERVRILSGFKQGQTGKLDRLHGGKGFAGVWLVWLDGTQWGAPAFGVSANQLERIQ